MQLRKGNLNNVRSRFRRSIRLFVFSQRQWSISSITELTPQTTRRKRGNHYSWGSQSASWARGRGSKWIRLIVVLRMLSSIVHRLYKPQNRRLALGLCDVELSILLCDDAFIHPLNRDYRGKDKLPMFFLCDERRGRSQWSCSWRCDYFDWASTRTSTRKRPSNRCGVACFWCMGTDFFGYDHEEDEEAIVMEAKEKEIFPC